MSKTLSDEKHMMKKTINICLLFIVFISQGALLMFKNCQGFSAVYIIQIEFK